MTSLGEGSPSARRSVRLDNDEASVAPLLEREILGSYILRARVLAALFAFGLAVALLTRYTPAQPPEYAFGSGPSRIVIAFIAFLAVYEASVAVWATTRRRRDLTPPEWTWYLNSAVELTAPTLAMWLMATRMASPPFALATPVVLVYFGFIALSTLRLSPTFSVFTGSFAALQYALLSVHLLKTHPLGSDVDPLFSSLHFPIQRAVILFAVGVGCAFVASELRRRVSDTITTWQASQRILRVFGEQTSPEVAAALLEGSDRTRENRFVCVLFLDIRNFSTYAESRSPAEVVAYLEAFFDFAIESVVHHHGHVHQLLGDGFMAIFGAPRSHGNDCANAVAAAFEIIARLEQAVQEGRLQPTELGIGIHAGDVVAGSVGSPLHREYKVTGDAVNVAARVEGLTKTLEAALLVTEAVWRRLDEPRPEVLDRRQAQVRGRREPVQVLTLA